MSQFRDIGRTVLKHAQSCCNQLMYGWKPACNISKVRDTLSDITYSYSFVTDPANGLSDAYLELSRLACLAEVEGLMRTTTGTCRLFDNILTSTTSFRGC